MTPVEDPLGTPHGVPPALRPPAVRSRIFERLTAAAAAGRFELQVCAHCAAVQYPPREACHRCLSEALAWTPQSGDGELISATTLFHSHDEFFRERLPWRVGLVRLDCGPTVLAHLHAAVSTPPARVRIVARIDRSGQAVLVALPETQRIKVSDDPKLAEILI